jgi:DNA/RNA-binding domain of Phe-tRNA-synthetase-like protein
MFMAELKNQLLTAGHDLDVVAPPVRVDVAKGDEEYTLLSGQPQTLKASDMMMADAQGVISSVVYGPDRRTQITRKTQRVLFAVYAPPGVEAKAVNAHLEDIEEYVKTASPLAERELLEVYSA